MLVCQEMTTVRVIFLCLLGWALSVAGAQTAPHAESVPGIRVGPSYVSLPGPWKFSPGDSPGSGETPLWASPSFDDSAWSGMDLHAKAGQIDPGYGDPEYLKGWSAHGFPRLVGYAWYRLRIHVASATEAVWIKMPDHVDDSYQVYANGQYVGEFGHFTADGVACYRSRAMTFPLPAPDAHGNLLIAIRFYEEPFVLVGGTTGDSGGMHQAPVVGIRAAVQELRARERTGRLLDVIVSIFVSGFLFIAAAGALWIWLIDRPRRTYLWLALGLVSLALPALVIVVAFFTYLLTQGMVNEFTAAFSAIGLVAWIFFWRDWFGLQWGRRMNLLALGLVVLESVAESGIIFSTHIPISLILATMVLRAAGKFALGILLFVALYQGARKDRTGVAVALPPILLLIVSQFSQELISWFRIRTSIFPFGVQITVQDAAHVLLVLVTGALAVRRFIGSQVSQRLERQTIDQEMEQARELQQRVLVPEENTSALFAVQTAYHPARTVGGDFFQVIAYPDDSLLVVVGDVSGKGMAAAMLVAVLVGALRTRADETSDPAEILRTLNERLLGRAGSHFATCVAAHLSPRGVMTVANAGHLPPYVNGVALDLPGSMPLGILPGNRPDVETVALSPGDYISFLTDGVLEARNDAGQLLGFEQTARLSSQPAEAIALAAILHGQDDDITVVGVSLAGVASKGRRDLRMEASPA
jgi:serine phosphatase RsbU (regulator of sigma subunit)